MLVGMLFAQSDDDGDNYVIGQSSEGNKPSQSESSSQDTNQNTTCVSGESTSLCCNNLSGQSVGSGSQGERGPTGAQGEA